MAYSAPEAVPSITANNPSSAAYDFRLNAIAWFLADRRGEKAKGSSTKDTKTDEEPARVDIITCVSRAGTYPGSGRIVQSNPAELAKTGKQAKGGSLVD